MTYSEIEKRIISVMREEEISYAVIAKILNKKESAIRAWWSRNRLLIGLPDKIIVSKKKTDGRIGLQIKRIVQEDPEISVREIERVLLAEYQDPKRVPKKSTISNFLQVNKLQVIKLLKRPFVSDINKARRIQFAKKHLEDVDGLIDATIWSDETTVRKAPKSKSISFRVHAGTKPEDLPFNYQFQNGGFSVMFWGCISIWGIGPLVAMDGSQNSDSYIELLKSYVIPKLEAAKELLGVEFTFMQDNAPCHKSKKVTEFLANSDVSVLDWPAQSPDLNPIENIWNIIKERRRRKYGVPQTRADLIKQIFDIWSELTVNDVENCITNMERRLLEVLRMKGRATKY